MQNGDSQELTVRDTVYGPIITDLDSEWVESGQPPLALKWLSLDPSLHETTFDAVFGMEKATNYSEWKESLSKFQVPGQNIVFASEDGDIAYQCTGLIPIRKSGHSGIFPVHSNDSFDWQGFVDFEENPFVLNPPEGFIASANNPVAPSLYPHHIASDWEDRYRYERIRDLIFEKKSEKLSIQDVINIQQDVRSGIFEELKPLLEKFELSGRADEHKRILLNWDGNSDADAREPTIWWKFYKSLASLPSSEVNKTYWDWPYYLGLSFEFKKPHVIYLNITYYLNITLFQHYTI